MAIKIYIYTIKNEAMRGKAFRAFGGLHEVPSGEQHIVGLKEAFSEEQIAAYKDQNVQIKAGGDKSKAVNADIFPEDAEIITTGNDSSGDADSTKTTTSTTTKSSSTTKS